MLIHYHDHAEDMLPDEHPLAWQNVQCQKCGMPVHAANNECMTGWFELPDKDDEGMPIELTILCWECFEIWLDVRES